MPSKTTACKKSRARQIAMANEVFKRRKELGLTQAELAKRVGCSRVTITHIESAENFAALPLYWELCEKLGAGKALLT